MPTTTEDQKVVRGFVIPILSTKGKGYDFFVVPQKALQEHPNLAITARKRPLIPPQLVEQWGLREMDEISFTRHGKVVAGIISVNGLVDYEMVKNRPWFADHVETSGNRLGYPREEWPIDITRDPTTRALRAIAPIGPGSQVMSAGDFGSGKTTTILKVEQSLLELAGQNWKKMAFVHLQAGERTHDVTETEKLLAQYAGRVPLYHFQALVGLSNSKSPSLANPTQNNRNLAARIVADAAKLLAIRLYESGYHVIFIVDSLAGLAKFVYAPHYEGSAATSGGIPARALNEAMLPMVQTVGMGPEGHDASITGIFAALMGSKSNSNIFDAVGGPNSTTVWMHRPKTAGVSYPSLSMTGNDTTTRRPDLMFQNDPERLWVHQQVRERCARQKNPQAALKYLHQLAECNREQGHVCVPWDEAVAAWQALWAQEDKTHEREQEEQWAEEAGRLMHLLRGTDLVVGYAFNAVLKALETPKAMRRVAQLLIDEAELAERRRGDGTRRPAESKPSAERTNGSHREISKQQYLRVLQQYDPSIRKLNSGLVTRLFEAQVQLSELGKALSQASVNGKRVADVVNELTIERGQG